MRTEVVLFELPRLLGIPQHVEYEPPPREWCTPQGCPHEGVLTAEGCRRGVCIRYRAWVFSWDGRRWVARERWRGRRGEDAGGCLRQQVADALWELAERGYGVEVDGECGVVINGVRVGHISCRSVNECVESILRAYEYAKTEPRRDPAEEEYEELLQRYPQLRYWRRDVVIDAIKRGYSWALQNLLSRLASVDEKVWAFLGRFDIDFRYAVEVYARQEELCVRFYAVSHRYSMYCYRRGGGWRPVDEMPKFVRHQSLENGGLAEVYLIGGKEFVRVV